MASSFQFQIVGGGFDFVIVLVSAAASGRIINGLAVMQTVSLRTTLKAFANSSPGLRFGNPGNIHSFLEDAALKELRRGFVTARLFATPSELRRISCATFEPRVSKQTPGLEFANAFGVISYDVAESLRTKRKLTVCVTNIKGRP